MGKTKSIKMNFIMESILTMSSFIFPLITFPYVSRILLPEGTGKVSLATSIISYFSIIANLGIPKYGIRICAKVRDDYEELSKTTHELLLINAVMSVVSYLLFFLMLGFVPKLRAEKTLYIVVSLSIFFNTISIEWLYKGLEQYAYITIRSLIFKLIALIAMFLLVHQEEDYVIYGGISIFAASASGLFNFIYAHHFIRMKPMGDYNIKKHLKPVFVFFAMACATTVYTHLDTVMLGFLKTDDDVGYYNASVKIKIILVSIVTSLGTVLLPRVSYYVQHGEKEKFLAITKKAINFVFLLAAPLTVYFMLFARQGILFLSGAAYEPAVVPMKIIMPTLLIIGLSNITGIQILVPLGKEKVVLWSEIVGAIVDLVLNFIFIPFFASIGAAIGTLVAELVVLAAQYYSIRNIVNDGMKKIHYGKILLALVLSVLGSVWLLELQLGAFITLLFSAALFFGIYGLMLIILKEQLVMTLIHQMKNKFVKRKNNEEAGDH